MNNKISYGDIWLVDLDPVVGHEQGSKRPCLVISADLFNGGSSNLAVVVPLTTKFRDLDWYVPVNPPEGGLERSSFIMCHQPTAVSFKRFSGRSFGKVGHRIMAQVKQRLRYLLDL